LGLSSFEDLQGGEEEMVLRYTAAWVPMVLIAIVNAIAREQGYGPHLDELRAHQLSTLTAILLFGVYIWALTRWWRIRTDGQAIAIGLVWLGLTVAFEFLFGHYAMGNSWEHLLSDYNILKGRVWILVLIWVSVAPYAFYRLKPRVNSTPTIPEKKPT
jgi:hypothetical protein